MSRQTGNELAETRVLAACPVCGASTLIGTGGRLHKHKRRDASRLLKVVCEGSGADVRT